MRMQRTRAQQLRAPLTTTLGHPKVRSAISTHVCSIINLIDYKYYYLHSPGLDLRLMTCPDPVPSINSQGQTLDAAHCSM